MIFNPEKDSFKKITDYLNKLIVAGKTIEIKEYKPKRSNLQNRYYWAIITMLSQETGNEKNDLHEYFKYEFLEIKTCKIEIGKYKTQFPSTTSTIMLNTKQFTDYIEKIRIFVCMELGVEIPTPEDYNFKYFLEYYENLI